MPVTSDTVTTSLPLTTTVDGHVTSQPQSAGLPRTLGLWDVTTITAGNILGSAIFVAAAFVPRELPHPTLVLLVWVLGGLIAVAGALSYAELGTMQRIGLVTFNAWALDGYLKVFWRNAPVWELWPQVAVLAGLTIVFLAGARVVARKWEAV